MERQIKRACSDGDAVVLLLDATRPDDRVDLITSFLARNRKPLLAVLNKVDRLSPEALEPLTSRLCATYGLDGLLPLSALTGTNVDELLQRVEGHLPAGPPLYPEEMVAEQPERFFAAEIIREAAFNELDDELPYAVNVAIEEFSERNTKTYINSILYVERESQRGIVIGKKGGKLREIGRQARLRLEDFLQHPVYLDLWVRVRPKWRNRDRDLKEFGYR